MTGPSFITRADLTADLARLGIAPGDTSDPCVAALPDNFIEQIVTAYLATGAGRQGKVVHAESVLVEAAEIVPFAISWMERSAG